MERRHLGRWLLSTVTLVLSASAIAAEGATEDEALPELECQLRIRDGSRQRLVRGQPVQVTDVLGRTRQGRVVEVRGRELVLYNPIGGFLEIRGHRIVDIAEVELTGATYPLGPPVELGDAEWRVRADDQRRRVERALGRDVSRSYVRYLEEHGPVRGSVSYPLHVTTELKTMRNTGYVLIGLGSAVSIIGLALGLSIANSDPCANEEPGEFCVDFTSEIGMVWGSSFGAVGLVHLVVGAVLAGVANSDLDALKSAYSGQLGLHGVGPWIDQAGQLRGATVGFTF